MKKSTIGVLGIGVVGSAIVKVFEKKFKVLEKDIKKDEIKNKKIEVLHICIPYNIKFAQIVSAQIKKNKPELVIIHSTIKPGTTGEIYKKIKTAIVHSPVMGTHDNLPKYLLKFTKIIGPVNKKSASLAKLHFTKVGIKSISLKTSLESEVGKLLDTTYYSWNIIFNKLVWKLCSDLAIDFESVYTKFNQIYNKGYKETSPQVIRPILKYKKGEIGGHCVKPNLEILDSFYKSPITKFTLDQNKKFKDK